MGDFLLSRILMFKVLEEELGDDKGQYTAKAVGCFHLHTVMYVWKRSEMRSCSVPASLKASWYSMLEKH